MKAITVFTPTYNRAYCLPILYESLLRQTNGDFEWLVIDDGSADNTRELVQRWMEENKISIRYEYKENGGMHTGHNLAYRLIATELNVCIDSDDYLPDNGIETFLSHWKTYGSPQYAGMIGLDATVKGAVIGTSFPTGMKACTFTELKPRYNVYGDKKIVYRTDIVNKLAPYPEFAAERFTPLYYPTVIDASYQLLAFNDIFCIVDYQLDGSTINIFNQYFKNPKGFSHSRKIEMVHIPFAKLKFKSAIHYVATSIMSRNWNFLSESPRKGYTFFAIPFGIALYFYLLKKRNQIRDVSKEIDV
jgi:glycosyltransferase involved in cell wall biosynthesis